MEKFNDVKVGDTVYIAIRALNGVGDQRDNRDRKMFFVALTVHKVLKNTFDAKVNAAPINGMYKNLATTNFVFSKKTGAATAKSGSGEGAYHLGYQWQIGAYKFEVKDMSHEFIKHQEHRYLLWMAYKEYTKVAMSVEKINVKDTMLLLDTLQRINEPK